MAAAAAAAATAARAIRREEKAMKKAEKEDRKESESKHISTVPDGSAPIFNKRTSISTLVELQIPNRDGEQDVSPKCSLDHPRNDGAGLLVSDSYPWQAKNAFRSAIQSVLHLRREVTAKPSVETHDGTNANEARSIHEGLTLQRRAEISYNSTAVQVAVAILIALNFIANAVEKQVTEPTRDFEVATEVLEWFFTVMFTLELGFNMYAHGCRFWGSGWNVFDFVVVAISLMAIALSGLPGVSTLRLMRAFRVFRLFKRLESLRKIVRALEAAIPGCMNAFSILMLISGIYAILGVEFFSAVSPYYFQNFSASFFTLFQVMTGDSWSEDVARPIIDVYPLAALYFISYILVTSLVLMNVVVAVLLEKIAEQFGKDPEDEEEDDSEPEEGSEVSHEETWRDFITDTAQEWRDKVSELRQLTRTLEVEAKSHLNKTTLLQSRYSNAYDIYEKAMHQAQAAEQESREGTKEPAGEGASNPAPDLGAETSSKSYLSKRPSLLSPHGVSMRSILEVEEWPEVQERSSTPITWASSFYYKDNVQIGVALLIFLNFVQNAIESQVIDPTDTMRTVFLACELFFTVAFTLELVVNMTANWFWQFWRSGWNVFDFVVVIVGLVSLVIPAMPGVSTLRLMRAFRVFRLFKKLKSLRIILSALEDAIPGCMNAFSILVLVTSIYAILGVEFFATDHTYYFKNFSAAFFTMFQVMTGDGWAEEVARPVVDMYPQAAVFFISYILIATIMLMNVVIAVLLEKMAETASADADTSAQEKIDSEMLHAIENGTDPMLPPTLQQQIRVSTLRNHLENVKLELEQHMSYMWVISQKLQQAAENDRIEFDRPFVPIAAEALPSKEVVNSNIAKEENEENDTEITTNLSLDERISDVRAGAATDKTEN